MNRQTRRKMERTMGEESTEKLSEKIFQFQNLPQSCDVCNKEFDKQDRDMIQSWKVVVRQEAVRLFCPDCLDKAELAVRKHLKDKTSKGETE